MHEPGAPLTPIEQANLLAGHAAGYATAFLDGRHDTHLLAGNAGELLLELIAQKARHGDDLDSKRILTSVHLLAMTMLYTARAEGEARQDRWQRVLGSLVELVRSESRALIPAQRAIGHAP